MRPGATLALAAAAIFAVSACGGGDAMPAGPQTDTTARPARGTSGPPVRAAWPRFGLDASRTNASGAPVGITAANVGRLRRVRLHVPGTVDSSPISLRGVRVAGAVRDVFVVTTTYGRTLALDARGGRTLWTFTPRGIGAWEGSAQIATASPVSDGRWVWAAAPDGRIHKLALSDGTEVHDGAWPVALTRDPAHEKLASALNLYRGSVLAVTGGYIGDIPPYQGHVAAIDGASGRLRFVFNTLCSDRRELLDPPSCPATTSAIWARAGAVVEPGTGRILVATGNGPFDGRTNWGDSVLELTPGGRLRQSWTPPDQASLAATDTDLGSTAPALIPHAGGTLAVQGGKDAKLHVLRLRRLEQVAELPAPGGGEVFTAPAVWRHGGTVRVFVATSAGTAAYVVTAKAPYLRVGWADGTAGTSPVVAGGLLYVYDPGGALNVYDPARGRRLAHLAAAPGHWNSPVVASGRILVPEGNANAHATSGTLSLYVSR